MFSVTSLVTFRGHTGNHKWLSDARVVEMPVCVVRVLSLYLQLWEKSKIVLLINGSSRAL